MEPMERTETKKSNIWVDFLPAIVLTVAGIATLFVYLFVQKQHAIVQFLALAVAPLIALVIPVLNRICKIEIPFALNVAIGVFTFAAIDLGTVLNFYALIPQYDKILHTLFGLLGAFCVFVLLLYGNGENLRPWCFFLLILLCVLGVAGLWEIYEFVEGAITHTDPQRWMPDLSTAGDLTVREFFASYHPLRDTMWDIIVAAFGVFAFYLLIFIDKLCGYRVCKRIYAQIKTPRKNTAQSKKIT